MQKQVLNYRIIIEPEKMGKKVVYNVIEHNKGHFNEMPKNCPDLLKLFP